MAISCIIVDDEELAVQHLSSCIEKVPFLRLDAYFTDPTTAINYLETNKTDLVFLDIEMPNFSIDGLDFVNIMGEDQNYVFTTAHSEYAIQGYDYNVIDFLYKPFSFERFLKAVQKARQSANVQLDEQKPEASDQYTYVKYDGRLQKIYFDDICWIESERNYISIYTEKERVNVLLSISDIESQLPQKLFARIHKSYIVAYNKVEFVEKDQIQIQRQQHTKTIPLGESYKKAFILSIEQKTLRKK